MNDRTRVENKDCIIAMREFPDKYFDLAIVDPPYGIGNWVQTTGNVRGKAVKWNDSIPNAEYFTELKRVSKERIIWGANYYNCFCRFSLRGSGPSSFWTALVGCYAPSTDTHQLTLRVVSPSVSLLTTLWNCV